MRHVRDRRALHEVRRVREQVYPGVVLDFPDRAAQHLHDGNWLPPDPARHRARQDDQALGLPAHAGRQVVKAEQLLERVGILGAPLHLVQQLQLPLQQRLVAPGQAAEDEADPVPQPRLVDRGLHRRPLDHRERLRRLGHLTRPGAQVQRRRLGRHVHLVACAQAADHAGQPLAGHVRAAPRSPVSSRLIRLPNLSSRMDDTMTATSPAPPTRIRRSRIMSPACA